MGAILSKFCFSCCTGLSSSKSRSSASKSSSRKLSHRPSLIIQRSQVFREAEAGSEYSRVLEREFEIWGSGVVGGDGRSPLGEDGTAFINRPHSASNESVETNGDYPRKVFQLRHKESRQLFTLVRIKKSHLNSHSAASLFREISLLARRLPHHPFLVNLYWTWQDGKYLYRVDDGFEFPGEPVDSYHHPAPQNNTEHSISTWDELVLRAGQLATAVHYIHSYGLIHGNINPLSVALLPGSLKLGHFKYLREVEGGRRLSGLCGDLEEFRAPECTHREYFEEIDWYSYGKVIQFWHQGRNLSDRNNLLKDLILKLTDETVPEANRLGYGPAAFKSIQSHGFFHSLDWTALLNLSTPPDFKRSFASLSQSIGSLKAKSASQDADWKEFLEFNWDEGGEIGRTLESIIKH